MRIEIDGRYKHIILNPGEYYCTDEPAVISTLLGSCVAACLYDPVRRIIGMNHFLLSGSARSGNERRNEAETGRYGLEAMELLINEMLDRGAVRKDLCAKVFGGAAVMMARGCSAKESGGIGDENCAFVRRFLADEGIPVIAEHLGDAHGRVIHFSNGDFAVYVRKTGRGQGANIGSRDRLCWQQAIKVQQKTMPAEY